MRIRAPVPAITHFGATRRLAAVSALRSHRQDFTGTLIRGEVSKPERESCGTDDRDGWEPGKRGDRSSFSTSLGCQQQGCCVSSGLTLDLPLGQPHRFVANGLHAIGVGVVGYGSGSTAAPRRETSGGCAGNTGNQPGIAGHRSGESGELGGTFPESGEQRGKVDVDSPAGIASDVAMRGDQVR